MNNPKNDNSLIFILGAPGSGKGAICKKLLEDYGFYHLSVGDMIRQLSNETDCRDRATIQENLQHGDLLPTWLIIPLLTVKIDEEMEMGQHQHYLVDGFPRELSQAKEAMKEIQIHIRVISFNCPKEIAKQRYLTRKLPGRLDDTEQMFEKRYAEFEQQNPLILEFFKSCDSKINVDELDSSTETEVTYARLLETLGEKYGWERKIQAVND